MMRVFISVVSHRHFEIISSLKCLKELARHFIVVVKSNVIDPELADYCKRNNIFYFESNKPMGFGQNNNDVYNYCCNILDMQSDDLFVVLNPDVIIDENKINQLKKIMQLNNIDFATINLYRDLFYKEYDPSIRRFPKLTDFISSFLGLGNKTIIDKSVISEICHVDWSAGSFLALKSDIFKKVGGFNQLYFMYCEDIDICMRLNVEGHKLSYIPSIKAVHLARQNNRKIFSKHFLWHLRSMIIYLNEKRKYGNKKSINSHYKIY
ncbi:glycosyltransferase family 2 protein [Enterobacter sp.]|uniref:glycosyltransferase family 2 protein n=1 Tax=Enterobacter sp. TaxID=42895 RepID=UPI00296ECFAB|nr:glycosyltransferase family 2 protein [Enterobacter sp.]